MVPRGVPCLHKVTCTSAVVHFAMHPRLAPLVADIERLRKTLLAALGAHSMAHLECAPTPDAWSPAQILEHLAMVEGGVARLLAKRLQRAQEVGLARESSTEPVHLTLETAVLTQ